MSSGKEGDPKGFHKPDSRSGETRVSRSGINNGIDAVHVNSAREMVKLHTRGRHPVRPKGNQTASQEAGNVNFARLRESVSSSYNISVPASSHQGACTNPQCAHCGSVIIPSPSSSIPVQDLPSISINEWSIYTIKKPILNTAETEHLNDTRFPFPLPEMIFGNNVVKIVNDKTNSAIEFNALDALDTLEQESQLKVSYHKEWLESRKTKATAVSSKLIEKSERTAKENSNTKQQHDPIEGEGLRPYDWTYSINYKGTAHNFNFVPTDKEMPVQKLLRPDPILFFDESVLFEDELGDNGISLLTTKIRVMPTCLLLLSRFFLRIDNVIFRVRDTRIYIDFDSNLVLREYKEQEGSYDDVLKKVTDKNDPKKAMRDTNWVSQNIPIVQYSIEASE
ncbi:Piso0_003073 [Millerozyma farinosa CBS 7064]|uniref:Piso0_003073 protein n=1 Tax=Pichia sorbitophila (strain ATCC MYA-4447 / BCRC 22081 / CBS 7064 / NBRC 10061 / NRRL Y-12695) TaxID=559304 RepID=G8YKA0_PICSO|nr:Piso0_003073 [Millerozyma farinosa CBS 7064]CCE80745.1 Piso0_003073 [Millerozyma farinosa CBS 7064]